MNGRVVRRSAVFAAAAAAIAFSIGGAQAAGTLSATASASPQIQYLDDSAGTVFTFTVKNTGTSTIGAVEIRRPSSDWTVVACPQAPAGWSAQRSDVFCRYRSGGASSDLQAGASSSGFQLKATTGPGQADRTGTWSVSVSADRKFDHLKAATADPAGALDVHVHSFELLDAVVADTAPSPGSACPPPNRQAETGSTHVIVICGRVRTITALTPTAAESSLGGTFIASPGTFSSSVVSPSATSVVLGNWSGATITSSNGPNKTVVARIGALATQTSPLTTFTGYTATNQPPHAVDDGPYDVLEDHPLNVPAPGVLGNDSDPEGDPLTAALASPPSNGNATVNADGSFQYSPNADYNGGDSFTYTVSDNHGGSDTGTVTINVAPVNDPPSFTLGGDQTVEGGAGPQSVAGFASAISPGPPNESSQTVHFNVSNDNTGLFSAQPAIDASGTLTYTPVSSGGGTATVTVTAQDDGGTANGGVDTSAPQTFKITVHVNQPPTPVDGAHFGTAVNNTLFTVGTTGTGPEVHVAGSVLAGATDPDGPAPITAVAGTITTANGGTVHLNSDGSFDYISAPGFGGTADSFQYQARDGGGATSAPATVNIDLGGHVVWYVDSSGGGGDGRSTAPFASLAPLPGADGPGDTIFVYQGSGTYAGGLVLKSGQSLVGQPAGLTLDSLTIAPSGSNPVITNGAGDGITVADNTKVDSVTVDGASDNGISGTGVSNVSVADSVVTNSGDSATQNESGIRFTNLLGTSSISGTEVSGSVSDNVRVVNSAGTLTNLALTGDNFHDNNTSTGTDGLIVEADGTATMTVHVTNTTLARNGPRGIEALTNDSGALTLSVKGSTLTTNAVQLDMTDNSSGPFAFTVSNNTTSTTSTAALRAINVFLPAGSPAAALLSGTISGNHVTDTHASGGSAVAVSATGAGSVRVALSNNTVNMVNKNGIDLSASSGSAHLDATVTGNTVHLSTPAAADRAIIVQSGALSTDTTAVCADLNGNTATTGAGVTAGIRVRNRFAGTDFRLPGFPGPATLDTAVVAFIVANNPGTLAAADHGSSPGFGGGGACASP
jgi:hypothetical protein